MTSLFLCPILGQIYYISIVHTSNNELFGFVAARYPSNGTPPYWPEGSDGWHVSVYLLHFYQVDQHLLSSWSISEKYTEWLWEQRNWSSTPNFLSWNTKLSQPLNSKQLWSVENLETHHLTLSCKRAVAMQSSSIFISPEFGWTLIHSPRLCPYLVLGLTCMVQIYISPNLA